jgi:hypothetical protein
MQVIRCTALSYRHLVGALATQTGMKFSPVIWASSKKQEGKRPACLQIKYEICIESNTKIKIRHIHTKDLKQNMCCKLGKQFQKELLVF